MELQDYRQQIDQIDAQLTELFQQRMQVSSGIAEYKKAHNLPVYDPARERAKLKSVAASARPELQEATERLYSMLFELSRGYQRSLNAAQTPLMGKVRHTLENTPSLFPEHATVACQGVEGAYSQSACQRLFRTPDILYFAGFDGVFRAIDKGLCRYGVLPLENSSAGSVNRIYDLMMEYDFSIVRSVRVKVDHALLTLPGVRREEIGEVVSHPQALAQCEGYLQKFPNLKITPVENTAAAARMVAESGRKDLAALASPNCGELYGLTCLENSVQDHPGNYTRFICISKNPEIYPGADRTSVMLRLPHRPGSLYHALGELYALDVNLLKLESRPIPGSDFQFQFYFDLETSVYSDRFLQMLSGLEEVSSSFRYLGSYSEVI